MKKLPAFPRRISHNNIIYMYVLIGLVISTHSSFQLITRTQIRNQDYYDFKQCNFPSSYPFISYKNGTISVQNRSYLINLNTSQRISCYNLNNVYDAYLGIYPENIEIKNQYYLYQQGYFKIYPVEISNLLKNQYVKDIQVSHDILVRYIIGQNCNFRVSHTYYYYEQIKNIQCPSSQTTYKVKIGNDDNLLIIDYENKYMYVYYGIDTTYSQSKGVKMPQISGKFMRVQNIGGIQSSIKTMLYYQSDTVNTKFSVEIKNSMDQSDIVLQISQPILYPINQYHVDCGQDLIVYDYNEKSLKINGKYFKTIQNFIQIRCISIPMMMKIFDKIKFTVGYKMEDIVILQTYRTTNNDWVLIVFIFVAVIIVFVIIGIIACIRLDKIRICWRKDTKLLEEEDGQYKELTN